MWICSCSGRIALIIGMSELYDGDDAGDGKGARRIEEAPAQAGKLMITLPFVDPALRAGRGGES